MQGAEQEEKMKKPRREKDKLNKSGCKRKY
jgi:hypothetical protein